MSFRKFKWCPSCAGSTKRELTLAIFGLDGAGKTRTIQALKGGKPGAVAPTVGFRNEDITFLGRSIKLYDLGGSRNFRGVWQSYVHGVHGMIYVIDSVDTDRFDESSDAFHTIISHERFVGKPVLILTNKQDLPNANPPDVIMTKTQMKKFATKSNCNVSVEACSAIRGSGRKIDPHLKAGLRWLCRDIITNYATLDERRLADMEEVKVIRDKEREEARARVAAIREQREKEEAEKAKERGEEETEEVEEEVMDGGDPFKPLNMDALLKKEAAAKAKKQKEKEAKIAQSQTPLNTNTSNVRVAEVHKNDNLNLSDSEYSDDADIIVPSQNKNVNDKLKNSRANKLRHSLDSSFHEDRKRRRKKKLSTHSEHFEENITDDLTGTQTNHIHTIDDAKSRLYSLHTTGNFDSGYVHDTTDNVSSKDNISNENDSKENIDDHRNRSLPSPDFISPRSGKRKNKLTPRKNVVLTDLPMSEMNGDVSIGTLSKVHLSPMNSDLNTSVTSQISRSDESGEETPPDMLRVHRYLKPVTQVEDTLSDLSPHEANKKRRKKKKSRIRRNQTSPSEDDLPPLSNARSRPLPPLPLQLNDTMRFPKDRDNDSGNESVHHNWAFADDLLKARSTPTSPPPTYNRRPNFEGDDIIT